MPGNPSLCSSSLADTCATGKGREKGDVGQCSIGLVRDMNPRVCLLCPGQPCSTKDGVGSLGHGAQCGVPRALATKHLTPGPPLSSLTMQMPSACTLVLHHRQGEARSVAAELMAEKAVFP